MTHQRRRHRTPSTLARIVPSSPPPTHPVARIARASNLVSVRVLDRTRETAWTMAATIEGLKPLLADGLGLYGFAASDDEAVRRAIRRAFGGCRILSGRGVYVATRFV